MLRRAVRAFVAACVIVAMLVTLPCVFAAMCLLAGIVASVDLIRDITE